MGDVVADAMLDRVKGQGVTIALQNGGGLRASIAGGKVTKGDVLAVLPFQNTLSTFNLSGAGIVAALENGVSQVEQGAGRFPQVAGLRFRWDPKVAPMQGRMRDVEVRAGDGWVPIDPDQVYAVVTNDFMRNGGDGYVTHARRGQQRLRLRAGPGRGADRLARRPRRRCRRSTAGSPGSTEPAQRQCRLPRVLGPADPVRMSWSVITWPPSRSVSRAGHEGGGGVPRRRLGGHPVEGLHRPAVDRPRRRRRNRTDDGPERIGAAQGVGAGRSGAGEGQSEQNRRQRSPWCHRSPPIPRRYGPAAVAFHPFGTAFPRRVGGITWAVLVAGLLKSRWIPSNGRAARHPRTALRGSRT